MKSKLLKNALAIGLAVVMSIGVAGCGAGGSSVSQPQEKVDTIHIPVSYTHLHCKTCYPRIIKDRPDVIRHRVCYHIVADLPDMIVLYTCCAWDSSWTKRKDEVATYSWESSIDSQRRPRDSDTIPVVLLPPKISTTRSLGSVNILIKNSGKPAGKRAGWPLTPTALQ